MLDEGSPNVVIYIHVYIKLKKKNINRVHILVFHKMAEYHIVNNIINLHFFSTGS